MNRRATLLVMLTGMMLLAGCGPRVMPRGKGATGKLAAVVAKPDLGLDKINTLSAEEQAVFDLLHQPFDLATLPPETFAVDPEVAAQWAPKIRQEFDAVTLAKVVEDQKVIEFYVRLVTDAGELTVRMPPAMVHPPMVRSFLAVATSGMLNGTPLELDGETIAFGSKKGESLFYLPHPDTHLHARRGAILSMTRDGVCEGSRFHLCFAAKEHELDAMIVGEYMGSPTDQATLNKMVESLKNKEKVTIREVVVDRRMARLFDGEKGADLPTLAPAKTRPSSQVAQQLPTPTAASDAKPTAPSKEKKADAPAKETRDQPAEKPKDAAEKDDAKKTAEKKDES